MPLTNSTASSSPYRSRARATGPSSARRPTTTRWAAGCSVLSLASASTRCTRPLSGTSALEVVTIRPGISGTAGSGENNCASAPMGTTWIRSARTPRSSPISCLDEPDTVTTDGNAARDALLHAREAVPAAYGGAAPPVRCRGEVQPPVHGDGVVDGRDERRAQVAQEPVSQSLVVVDDVELAPAGQEMAPGPEREGERLGKPAGPHGGDLQGVDPVPELAALRRTERVGLPVEVEAGQLGEGHSGVEYGVGLGAYHLDGVPEEGEFAGQVPDVDALTAAEGVALVAEQGDP